ncbi:CHASE domain-containing protein [Marinibactrum halimedae]|uniref:histidine kinase n=1 Tax=Marinibactrum halimedae TaxID=1444977 RepID=A0AA37TAE4_9GAMM|nr:CHASE domain-containing protein [Marinibactrum halimedae]MCD9461021.1 CHASE domain-containing protein [Marinibactrum halimedae]GLS27793.1 hypothetical protein GCM10007877_35120 [Marinibactrum halimedae]
MAKVAPSIIITLMQQCVVVLSLAGIFLLGFYWQHINSWHWALNIVPALAIAIWVAFGVRLLPAIALGLVFASIVAYSEVGVDGAALGVLIVLLFFLLHISVAVFLLHQLNIQSSLLKARDCLRLLFVVIPLVSLFDVVSSMVQDWLLGAHINLSLNNSVLMSKGDSLGVWASSVLGGQLALPLLLNIFHREVKRDHRGGLFLGGVLTIIVICVCIQWVYALQRERLMLEFQRSVDEIGQSFTRTLLMVESSLIATKALMQANPEVSEEKFGRFFGEIIGVYPGIQGIAWLPLVQHQDRKAFESRLDRTNADHPFIHYRSEVQVHLAPKRETYLPILYWNALFFSDDFRGYDPTHRADWRELIEMSEQSNSTIATTKTSLESSRVANSIYLVSSVYGSDVATLSTPRSIMGVVMGMVDVDIMVDGQLTDTQMESFQLSLIDNGSDSAARVPERLLYRNNATPVPGFVHLYTLNFGGRTYHLVAQPSPLYFQNLEYRDVSFLFLVVILFGGTTMGLVCLFTGNDQLHQKLVEDKTAHLSDSLRLAQESSSRKSQFIAMVSNEFRTPLNTIIRLSSRALTKNIEKLSAQDVDGLNSVKRNADRLLDMVGDIIDVISLDQANASPYRDDVVIEELLNEVSRWCKPVSDEKKIGFSTRMEASTAYARCDKRLIRQALSNLVMNAIQRTDTGSVEIVVDRIKEQQWMLRFLVHDTGASMEVEQLGQLFVPFCSSKDHENLDDHNGLGLLLVKEIAKHHGGDVFVDSSDESGNTFGFAIPASG